MRAVRRFIALGASAWLLAPAVVRAQTYEEAYGRPPPAQTEPPPSRRAPEPLARPFGAPGQWVVTGGSSLSLGSTTWTGSKASTTGVTFSPGLDLFVARNFSVGVSVNASFTDRYGYLPDGTLQETRVTTYSGGPRLGMNLPLAPRLSLYPRLMAGYASTQTAAEVAAASPSASASTPANASASVEHHGVWGSVDVPLVYQVRPHFFLAVVPAVTLDASSGKGNPADGGPHTTAGVGFLVGGWFGGADPLAAAEAPPVEGEPGRLSRFGDAGVVVLDAELAGYGYETTYGGPDSSSYDAFGVVAGVDYFVTDQLSLGAVVAVSHSDSTGVEPLTGIGYTDHQTRGSFGVRAGLEIPLAGVLSLYPRLTLGYASESFDLESGGAVNKGDDQATYLDAFAPLLVHVARHFFVGFGPEASTDLSRTFNPGNRSIQSNYVGAGLMVGGWL